ncbi:MAG: 1-acyl-sn-glycerol-3-phosphate acyltransferase [Bacteroidota bacterium]
MRKIDLTYPRKKFLWYYAALNWVIKQALYIYYRRVKVVNLEKNLPKDAPVMLSANHQSAFIDPINMVAFTPLNYQPSFLGRADAVAAPTGKFLRAFRCIPIYRPRDGEGYRAYNVGVFKECGHRLSRNGSILIFPEGNHDNRRRLRELKSGVARIGFEGAKAVNFEKPVYIQTIGLNYSDHMRFQSDLVVIYNEPINMANYYDLYQKDSKQAVKAVMEEVRERIGGSMIDLPEENLELIDRIRQISAAHESDEDIYAQWKRDMARVEEWENVLSQDPVLVEVMRAKVDEYDALQDELSLTDRSIAENNRSVSALLVQALLLLCILPVHVWGWVHHVIPYLLSSRLPMKIVKDELWYSSLSFSIAVIFLPIYYLILGLTAGFAFSWPIAGAYLISVMGAGWISLKLRHAWRVWGQRWRATQYARRDLPKFKQLKALGKEIFERMFTFQPN